MDLAEQRAELRTKQQIYLALKAKIEHDAYTRGEVSDNLRTSFKQSEAEFLKAFLLFCKNCPNSRYHSEFDAAARTILIATVQKIGRINLDNIF